VHSPRGGQWGPHAGVSVSSRLSGSDVWQGGSRRKYHRLRQLGTNQSPLQYE